MAKKTIVIQNSTEVEINEILEKDYLDINGEIYMKKSKVKSFLNDFIKHLERNGKIKILDGDTKKRGEEFNCKHYNLKWHYGSDRYKCVDCGILVDTIKFL